ncbi:hypothetical protein KAU33_16510 [Candidatus Dependentiae bacterium]|nr:hypothetical protein [Candidatus Dependentiae bacterium]
MTAKKVLDFQINIQLKKMLVERGIDTSKLQISTMGGTVYLRGQLDFMHSQAAVPGHSHQWMAKRIKFLRDLERDVKRLRGVRFVRFQLTNWEKDGDKWIERRY